VKPLTSLICRYQTRLERLAGDKQHSSLLRTFVNYGQKSFITLVPGPVEGLRLLDVDGLVDGARVVRRPDREGSFEIGSGGSEIVLFLFWQILEQKNPLNIVIISPQT
jgi:hypothetical protein